MIEGFLKILLSLEIRSFYVVKADLKLLTFPSGLLRSMTEIYINFLVSDIRNRGLKSIQGILQLNILYSNSLKGMYLKNIPLRTFP